MFIVRSDDGDDGDYLFVEFDEFVVAMAAHDGQHQRSPNRLLLTLLQFLPLRQPPQLDRVLELDESSLLDLDRERLPSTSSIIAMQKSGWDRVPVFGGLG